MEPDMDEAVEIIRLFLIEDEMAHTKARDFLRRIGVVDGGTMSGFQSAQKEAEDE